MSKIVIFVPKGRKFCGRCAVFGGDGAQRAGPFRTLGTASVRVARKHGNADASPLLPFGHPPTGSYVIAASLPPGYEHTKRKRRYGKVGGLLLAPRSGDALSATANGRKLIAVHGGPQDKKRRLRPTRGGVRLSNAHMRALLGAINDAQRDADPVASVEIVEIDMQLAGKRDKKGKHALRFPKNKPPASTVPSGVTSMLLLPLALGGAGKRAVARRELLAAAAVALGALALQACERPSNCSPLACPVDEDAGDAGDAGALRDGGRTRFGDAGCTPQGYACYGGEG